MRSIDAWLRHARALGVDRLDAQCLLAHALQRPRAWLLAHGEAGVDDADGTRVGQLLARRAEGVPVAYLTGEREFHGLRLRVTPDVLDPRPDTETLVDWALDLLRNRRPGEPAPEVLDLGTGSGAVALAVQHACPHARVSACDVSPAALEVASGNGRALGLPVTFFRSDWWSTVPARGPEFEGYDLILSNPPYIAAADPHLSALTHEPLLALSPGGDGLAALNTLVDGAARHLHPGGWLLLEHGHEQGPAVAARLSGAGFEAVSHREDLAGRVRCTGARLCR